MIRILVSFLLAGSIPLVSRADDPPPKPCAAITFQDIPKELNQKCKIGCVIELEGNVKPLEITYNVGAGLSGTAVCGVTGRVLLDKGGWEYDFNGEKMTIVGWTDPNTKIHYPVKKITFSSEVLPKEHLPQVKQRITKA